MRIYRYRLGANNYYGELTAEDTLARCVRLSPYRFELKRTGVEDRLADVELLVPTAPSKVVCVGRNYLEHARELGHEVNAERPLIFLKPPSCLIPSGAEIVLPKDSTRVDFEGEIALVISERCFKVEAGEAYNYLLGVTAFNDVTEREWQKADGQWTRAKGMNTFGPCGPYIDTSAAEALRLTVEMKASGKTRKTKVPLTVTTRVNGEQRQHASIELCLWNFASLISYISHVMTLEAGDIIATGTPSGVGPLQPGDEVAVELNSGPRLVNMVVAE
jgi:2-keto-4-pentenoate hydratase/2-oxohepta-3-ene-1,7-dioic acid hydratase in catechol pathway